MANEQRLIDANALIAEYDRVHIGHAGGARKLMEDAPTVDAVPVVHGRWVFRKNWDFFVCSQCSNESSSYSNYCPNCGSLMDGGNEDG